MKILLDHERACLFHGDSAELSEYLPENSIDAIVCDPPAAIAFMGKKWDDDRGGFDGWTRWLAGVLAPSVHALKPGGYMLCWALPRTSHWTARALELTGLRIRDVHHHTSAAEPLVADFLESLDAAQSAALERLLASQTPSVYYQVFGTGMPKSLDLAREIDMHLCELPGRHGDKHYPRNRRPDDHLCPEHPRRIEAGGMRTALAPAVEHWIMARKSIVNTHASNVIAHGTGGLNIEACRIGTSEPRHLLEHGRDDNVYDNVYDSGLGGSRAVGETMQGRWPPHFSLEHAPGCRELAAATEIVHARGTVAEKDRSNAGTNFAMQDTPYAEKTIEHIKHDCVPGCPVAELDAQSGVRSSGARVKGVRQGRRNGHTYGAQIGNGGPAITASKGGASRFFHTIAPFAYIAKAARSEKDKGLTHLEPSTGGEATGREDGSDGVANPRAGAGRTGGARNRHPTCKPVALMEWLLKLVVPAGGTVLDPFAGSGTTGVAAIGLGLSFIGADLGGDHGEYLPFLVGRIRHALGLPPDLTISADVPSEDVEQIDDEIRSEDKE